MFFNDETVKATFMASLADGLSRPLSQEELLAWGADQDVPPALWLLILALSKTPEGYSHEAVAELIKAAPIGAEVDTVPYAWTVWLAEQLAQRWTSDAQFTSLAQACADFIGLLKRAAAGETLSRSDWRQARKQVEAAATPFEQEAGYAGVLHAAAWDLSMMPGALSDVVQTWLWTAASDRSSWGDLWTEEDQTAFQALFQAEHEEALKMAGTPPEAGDTEANEVFKQRYMDAMNTIKAAHKTLPVTVRLDAFFAKRGQDEAERVGQARDVLKDLLARAPVRTVAA